jgi:hypothetical protein
MPTYGSKKEAETRAKELNALGDAPIVGHGLKYTMTSPCVTCPFRRNNRGFLNETGARRIAIDLLQDRPFSCHHTDRAKEYVEPQHCAGALIVLEKMQKPHLAMKMGQYLKLYDPTKLVMDHPHVFDNMKQFLNHHIRHLPGIQGVKGNNGPNLDVIEKKAIARIELPDEPEWRPVGKP